jgi:hypothetical protein
MSNGTCLMRPSPHVVIPAQAGLRRQDAGSEHSRSEWPKGEQQELRVIHCGRSGSHSNSTIWQARKMDSGVRRNDVEVQWSFHARFEMFAGRLRAFAGMTKIEGVALKRAPLAA